MKYEKQEQVGIMPNKAPEGFRTAAEIALEGGRVFIWPLLVHSLMYILHIKSSHRHICT